MLRAAQQWRRAQSTQAVAQLCRRYASDTRPVDSAVKTTVNTQTTSLDSAKTNGNNNSSSNGNTQSDSNDGTKSNRGSPLGKTVLSLIGISLISYSGAVYYATKDNDFHKWMQENVPATDMTVNLVKSFCQSSSSTVNSPSTSSHNTKANTSLLQSSQLSPATTSITDTIQKDKDTALPRTFATTSKSNAISLNAMTEKTPVPSSTTLTKNNVIESKTDTKATKVENGYTDTSREVQIVPAAQLMDNKSKQEVEHENVSITRLLDTLELLTRHFDALAKTTPSIQPSLAKVHDIMSSARADLHALSTDMSLLTNDQDALLNAVLHDSAESLKRTLERQRQKYDETLLIQRQGTSQELQRALDSERSFLNAQQEAQLLRERALAEKNRIDALDLQSRELHGRWKREVHDRVEHERNGRLAKLDHVTLKLKYLEQMCLINAEKLHKSYHIHSIFSALQALHTTLFDVSGNEYQKHTFRTEWELIRKLSLGDPLVVTALDTVSDIAQNQGIESLPNLHRRFTSTVAPEIRRVSLLPTTEHTSVFAAIRNLVTSFLPERGISLLSTPTTSSTTSTEFTSIHNAPVSATPPVGFVSYTLSRLMSNFIFPKSSGLYHGERDIESIIARVEYHLGREDLDTATRELNSLGGWPKELARDWLIEARRYLEVKMAVEVLHTQVALMSLGAV